MTKIVILTDPDLPKNQPLAKSIDELIPKLGGSSMEEVAQFFGFKEGMGFTDIYLLGDKLTLRITPTKQFMFRYQPAQTMPSITEQLANLAKATVRTVSAMAKGAPVMATKEQADQRLAICHSCDQFKDGKCATVTLPDGTVKRGCGCKLGAKVALAAETCPQGKW